MKLYFMPPGTDSLVVAVRNCTLDEALEHIHNNGARWLVEADTDESFWGAIGKVAAFNNLNGVRLRGPEHRKQ